ncbi:MAG: protein kinase [Cyanobacteria bacterium J06600_6]
MSYCFNPDWLRQLLDILELLHQQQYFHRDIKPSNIILQPNGRLALIDFGAAQKVTDTYLGKIGVNQGVTSIRTPGYIAPEQLDGAALPQSDFFSLGRTLVHLVTGKHPQSFAKNLELENIVWRSQAPQISVAFGDLLDLMMSHSPSKRPINVKSIRAILAQAEDYPHQSVSRLRPKRRLQAPKSSLILVWLLALFGLVSLGKNFQQQQVATSQENTPLCNNLTCINRDPIDNKCDRDAQTITSNIGNYLLGGKSMAYKIEVRYSPLCNAVWARSQAPYRSYHYIEDSEGKTYGKVRVIRDGWNRHYADMAPGKDIEIRACAEPPIGQINCTNFVAL